MTETMQNLSFNRATFGTWNLVVEYLGKQMSDLLNDNGKKPRDAKNDMVLCEEMFAAPSFSQPNALGRKELASISHVSIPSKSGHYSSQVLLLLDH